MTTPKAFYTEQLPTQWNRALRDQARAAEAAQRVLAGMRAANATLRIDIAGGAEAGDAAETFFLNIAEGELEVGDAAAHTPFLTLVQDTAAFERLAAEAGDSALGFLGGLSGLAGEMKLTKERIDALAAAPGTFRFSLTGEGGFDLVAHFGAGEPAAEPETTITVEMDAYQRLKSGELNPPDAFLGGQIEVDGDMQAAMQLALTMMAPD
jgi:hypothetical protein